MKSSRSGILSVDKGPGVTSFQVVARLRRALGVAKAGHGGTLDPEATGVLPILVGEATKLMPYLADLDKEYRAVVRLGVVTDTQDVSGTVLATREVPALRASAIVAVLDRFVGDVEQVPPMYSALHHEGKRLYEIARAGGTVERPPRRVRIHAIALEAQAGSEITIRVHCGKGTYVRTLAADVGEALGCGAALSRLVRTRVGPFGLDEAVSWADVCAASDGEALWRRLQPPDAALGAAPAVTLDAGQVQAFLHGQSIMAGPEGDGLVRVYDHEAAFLGVGVRRGGVVKPERLLHADPARPRVLPA